jgi:hypothetical protein
MIIGLILTAAAIVITGAYIRWAVRPVLAGYRVGVTMGRQSAHQYPVGSPVAGGRKRHSDTGSQLAAAGS